MKFKPGDIVVYKSGFDHYHEVYLVLKVNPREIECAALILNHRYKELVGKIVADFLTDGSLLKDIKLK